MDQSDLQMIAEGLERILADAPLEAIDHAGGQGAEAKALWDTLSENGYPRLCASEDLGGFGGSLADATVLAILAARHGMALPLADTMLTLGLLSTCGVECGDGPFALANPLDPVAPVAHAAQSGGVLVLEDSTLRLVATTAMELAPVSGAEDGMARVVSWPSPPLAQAEAPAWLTPDAFHALAALMRAAQMAGGMQAVLDLTLAYTQEREQFGRPLAKFQAIQHHLAEIACETAAAIAAVELARDALCADAEVGPRVIDEIAIAKIRCGEAASRVAAAAHQAHGAMGFTREYALGRFTRRLWQWQDEFGSETQWAERLGNSVLSDSEPRLWPRISQPI